MSRWARACGNLTGGGEGIIVMTTDEALRWCERHDIDAETVAQNFVVEEG
jgi:hypothetical protein